VQKTFLLSLLFERSNKGGFIFYVKIDILLKREEFILVKKILILSMLCGLTLMLTHAAKAYADPVSSGSPEMTVTKRLFRSPKRLPTNPNL
jgi:hypothetical protein